MLEYHKCNRDFEAALRNLEERFKNVHSRRSIRERFYGFLSKSNKKWTKKEDSILLSNFEMYGKQWTLISFFLINRSADQVRIRFKQLMKQKSEEKEVKTKKLEEETWDSLNQEFALSTLEANDLFNIV